MGSFREVALTYCNKNNLTGGAYSKKIKLTGGGYYTHTHIYIETWGNEILIHIYIPTAIHLPATP
jgi:hypothetical protein